MGARGPAEQFDGEEMFVWWFNNGERRTYMQVAEHFAAGYTTIREYADRYDWEQRADEIDADARRQLSKKLASMVAKEHALDIDTLRILKNKFRKRLRDTVEVGGQMVPNPALLHDADIALTEYLQAVKAFQLVTGGATERTGEEETGRLDLDAIEREIAELDRLALERGDTIEV